MGNNELVFVKFDIFVIDKLKKPNPVVESIIFKLEAELHELTIKLGSDKGDVAVLDIRGLKGQVVLKKPYTQISVNLNNISVIDLNQQSLHSQVITLWDFYPKLIFSFIRKATNNKHFYRQYEKYA